MREILTDFGLDSDEIDIYLVLLSKEMGVSEISKKTKVNRTSLYSKLEKMVDQGIISYSIQNGIRFYKSSSPDTLVMQLEKKKDNLKSIIPELEKLYYHSSDFESNVFLGKDGVKSFYQDIMNNAKVVRVIGATGRAENILRYSYPQFLRSFMSKNIKELAIANSNTKTFFKKHPSSHVNVKFFPKKFNAKVTTIIYGDKVGFQSLEENNIYVVLIKDKGCYETYKNQFDFMWELLN